MKNIDVLVVRPPQPLEEPTSFMVSSYNLAIATILENAGYSSRYMNIDFLRNPRYYQYNRLKKYEDLRNIAKFLLDENHPKWRNFKKILKEYNPKVLILLPKEVYNLDYTIKASKIAKNLNPNIKTIVYSYDRSFDDFFVNRGIDVSVKGDFSLMVVPLVKSILSNKSLKKIPNIVFKYNRAIIHTRRRDFNLRDLNHFPIPNRELIIDLKYYPPSHLGSIMASSGCPFRCKFCAGANTPVLFRDVDLIVEEMRMLHQKYRVRDFSFETPSISIDRKWAIHLFDKIIESKLDVLWGSYANSIHMTDENLIKKMKKSGCFKIGIGVESASQKILIKMVKPQTVEVARKAIELLKKHGIFVYIGLIIGYPEEKIEDIIETFRFIRETKPDAFIFQIFVPKPEAPIVKERGVKFSKRYMFWSSHNVLFKTSKKRKKLLESVRKDTLPLSNLCESIIFRKSLINFRIFRLKGYEYFNYFINRFLLR